ncbi:DUF378 domain-containing protein [Bacillus sp. FSL K6-3431]|uniref:DUF378 domain-containing protein n=1 Tax=Bacillus sp. FSL K6-3431 TaxID=2921500 RepID=UPI0030F93A14
MKVLRRIALALVIIGAINWGLIGLFEFDLVGSIFGGTTSGFARFIYTLVGISGIICIGLLFNSDTVDVPAREEHRGFTEPNYGTEFAEEPDLDKLYNPSREAYENEDPEEEELH